jgi:AbiV family abortive infection protein
VVPESEALQGAVLAAENAERLYMASAILSREGLIGQATALCVLSFEEAAKSIALTFRSQGVENEAVIKRCFREHVLKHSIGANMGSFSTRQLKKMGFNVNFNEENFTALEMEARIHDWEKQADNLKKQGFYVDYRNGSWVTPTQVTKIQWETGVIATGVVVAAAKALISTTG